MESADPGVRPCELSEPGRCLSDVVHVFELRLPGGGLEPGFGGDFPDGNTNSTAGAVSREDHPPSPPWQWLG